MVGSWLKRRAKDGMSQVGFPIEPLQFFIDLILLASKGNSYQG